MTEDSISSATAFATGAFMVDALRDASPWTLTFATGAFSPHAMQIALVTSHHVVVKRRLVLRPVPPGLELSEDLLDLIAKYLLRMQATAGMYARCSKAFKGAVSRAVCLLEVDEHIIYWTGSSPPIPLRCTQPSHPLGLAPPRPLALPLVSAARHSLSPASQ